MTETVSAERLSDERLQELLSAPWKLKEGDTRKILTEVSDIRAQSAEPVAWRWKPDADSEEWTLLTRKPDSGISEPLYASPVPATSERWVLDEVERLRPAYASGSMLDVGGRQLLDHFGKLPARRTTPQASPAHTDDLAVDRFAVAMKAKLAKKRGDGRGGWEDKSDCSAEYLSDLLRDHVAKGDPVDVGNLSMMLHQRGERITP